ncbi:MAG: H-NS histone family protein [Alphaproteobacteria bacterium]|nr:H-NS histone family protein [Alphaproteobacteria bacterium]
MPRVASLTVIERKIEQLEAKAEAIRTADKPGMKQLRAVMKKYRLTQADVETALNGRNGKRPSALAGRKLVPKYRNPANKQDTWSGRGLKPKWLIAAMKQSGQKLDHFAI